MFIKLSELNFVSRYMENQKVPASPSQLPSNNLDFDEAEIIVQLESCAPLEASAPLESSVYVTSLWQINSYRVKSEIENISKPGNSEPNLEREIPLSKTENISNSVAIAPNLPTKKVTDSTLIEPTTLIVSPTPQPENIDAQIIRLLQERLVIDRKRRKIGEVIVRKEIETRIVEVPVRREKLIVEQISPEHKQLAAIDLGLTTNDSVQLIEEANLNQTVSYEFSSGEAAREFLQNITSHSQLNISKIRIDLTLRDETQ
jgi:hypothetical protein